jgi:hypothetical protein
MTLLRALRRLPPLETALLALGIVIAAWVAVATQAESDDAPQPDSFSTYDGASGGYRAFYALLDAEGLRVERFQRRPVFLDRGIDTLVYVEPLPFDPRRIDPTQADVAALDAWVRGGGRLLYVGHDDGAAAAGILHLPRSTAARHRAGPRIVAPELAHAGVGALDVRSTLRWKRPKRGFRVLYDDGRGPLAVAYPYGRGSVTALIDESLFENDGIARADRARFAYELARPRHPGGVVAFDETPHGYLTPEHWWNVVPRAFAIALAVALAAILVAIAGAAVRLGPPLVPVERRDRSSAAFIDALSTLLERGGATRKALLDASNSTSRAIARSFGLRDDVDPAVIAARIERPAVREAYRTLVAVAENGFPDRANLVRGVALAQRLRKEFAPHGRPRN